MAKEFSDESLETEITTAQKPILVDFWAEWCGPCKMMAPIIEEISNDFVDKVIVGKLDVDQHKNMAGSLGIRSIPTLVLFKGGRAVDVKVGVTSKEDLSSWLQEHL